METSSITISGLLTERRRLRRLKELSVVLEYMILFCRFINLSLSFITYTLMQSLINSNKKTHPAELAFRIVLFFTLVNGLQPHE